MQNVPHVVVVGFDVAHCRSDVRVIQQVLGEVDVPFGLLHQVGRQRVPEAMRCHADPEPVDQLLVHRFDLVGIHLPTFVVSREAIHVEQLVFGGEASSASLIDEPTNVRC